MTIFLSMDEAQIFKPCSYYLHSKALELEEKPSFIPFYFAKPIDNVISAIALLIFTPIDHFRDIAKESSAWVVFKLAATPISLPIKFVISIGVSVVWGVEALIQIVIPYKAIYALTDFEDEENISEQFFTARETLKNPPHHTQASFIDLLPFKEEFDQRYQLQNDDDVDEDYKSNKLYELKAKFLL